MFDRLYFDFASLSLQGRLHSTLRVSRIKDFNTSRYIPVKINLLKLNRISTKVLKSSVFQSALQYIIK